MPARSSTDPLARAVLETLAYFDVFDYPVRLEELHRYLHGLEASRHGLERALDALTRSGSIEVQSGYYALAARRSLIERYEAAARENSRRLHLAIRYGGLLARQPFIRMVAITGSVAMQNGGPDSDFDYLLVTRPGRLWTARLFAVALGRWTRRKGVTLCPNIVLSERALRWPTHGVYAAHELTQMIPVSGMSVYREFLAQNSWTRLFLPNAHGMEGAITVPQSRENSWQDAAEAMLLTPLGSALERLEMRRKISRFHRQAGVVGSETLFTPDVCQGNFDRHGERVRRAFEGRLSTLGIAPVLPRLISTSIPYPSGIWSEPRQASDPSAAAFAALPRRSVRGLDHD